MKTCILLALFSSALAVTNYQKKCGQSPDGGPCKASLTMWWFNAVSGECEEFEYGGCGGNENRYEDRAECFSTCSKEKLHLRPKEATRAVSEPARYMAESEANVCRRPPFSGPCMAYFPRFYFDALTKQCRPFVYGGCQSNGNNFETLRQCINLCATPAQGQPVPLVA